LKRIFKGERLTGRALPCRLLTGEAFLLIYLMLYAKKLPEKLDRYRVI